ncbi:TPA: Gfo/Idh/MocA family oxidoreductase [Candidatus Poribacteria bacterium]|nr:Gfo/Idh/MocA family oxidoreductase [Candidatus Poribacteria bacterium]
MSEKKVNLAIIGCGGMAGAHLNSYRELKEKGLDNFELLAMCDVLEDRAKSFSERANQFQEKAPSVYTSVEEMLEKEELDAADICSPHSYHHINAIPCLEAGVDVMIEKPFSVTIKAGKKIIETAMAHLTEGEFNLKMVLRRICKSFKSFSCRR